MVIIKNMHLQRKQIVIGLTAAVIIVCCLVFVHIPMNLKVRAFRSRQGVAELFVRQVEAQSGRLSQMAGQRDELSRQVEKYESSVPQGRNLGEFLQVIAALMDKYELKDQSVKPENEIAADRINCIPIDMHCRGKLARLFEFYKSLQSLDRLVRIEKLKLENDRDLTGEVSMETRAIIFYRSRNQL